MSLSCEVCVGRTSNGYLISISGPAGIRESFALREFFLRCENDLVRVIDLRGCTTLDSTFAGMLVKWSKDLNGQLLLVADEFTQQQLFCAMHLEGYFEFVSKAPQMIGDEVALDVSRSTSRTFGQHVMDCHDRLAQLEGPHQAIFSKIADKLEKELRG